ncbi:hypothetical protein EVAR_7639_1 [Eumeta japonica]|uniref:Uncharacterized protein n=1 Tax=Eumeta variegata TaxID=151549 RepID=A0A4C1TLL8_EUMVA|nr:hypothetical protein EVAR_7639_1 [Eumeta japonica]
MTSIQQLVPSYWRRVTSRGSPMGVAGRGYVHANTEYRHRLALTEVAARRVGAPRKPRSAEPAAGTILIVIRRQRPPALLIRRNVHDNTTSSGRVAHLPRRLDAVDAPFFNLNSFNCPR